MRRERERERERETERERRRKRERERDRQIDREREKRRYIYMSRKRQRENTYIPAYILANRFIEAHLETPPACCVSTTEKPQIPRPILIKINNTKYQVMLCRGRGRGRGGDR